MRCLVASSINNVIGENNKIPWRLPIDLKRVKELTLNQNVIMGGNTFDSLPNPFLEDRTIYVASRNSFNYGRWLHPQKRSRLIIDDLETCIQEAEESSKDTWVLGGEEIYKSLNNYVNELYVTLILNSYAGDKFFPWSCYTNLKLVEQSNIIFSKNQIPYMFLKYKRKINVQK